MKKRVLLVTEHDPRSLSYGAGQRTHNIWMALREVADVDVAWFCRATGDQLLIDNVGDTGIRKIQLPQRNLCDQWWNVCPSRKGQDALQTVMAGQRYDLVVARYIIPFLKLGLWRLGHRVVVDFDDPVYRDGFAMGLSLREFGKKATRFLNQYMANFKLKRLDLQNVWFLFNNRRDAQLFPHLKHGILPNIPVTASLDVPEPKAPKNDVNPSILFVGLMSYPPNRLGVQYFLDQIWPLIRNANPSVVFKIAGKVPAYLKEKWSAYPNCEVLGYVDDLASVYHSSTIAVSPIYSGGGTNIKVPEAYLYGCPMVVSEFSYSGWNDVFTENENILVGYSRRDFAEKCILMLDHFDDFKQFAISGKNVVNAFLSIDQYKKIMGNFLEVV